MSFKNKYYRSILRCTRVISIIGFGFCTLFILKIFYELIVSSERVNYLDILLVVILLGMASFAYYISGCFVNKRKAAD